MLRNKKNQTSEPTVEKKSLVETQDDIMVDYKPILSPKIRNCMLGVFVAVFLVSFVLFDATGVYLAQQPTTVTFPESTLSDSIFESQNTKYKEIDGLSSTTSFENVPYLLDVPEGYSATVDNGNIYKIQDDLYMFITEFPSSSTATNTLIAQLGKSFLINIIESGCVLQPYARGEGYINGYSAVYRGDVLKITDGTKSMTIYAIGYEVKVTKDTYVYIGTASSEFNSALLNGMKVYSDALITTLRYDEDLDAKQIERRTHEAISVLTEKGVALDEEKEKVIQENLATKQDETKESTQRSNYTNKGENSSNQSSNSDTTSDNSSNNETTTEQSTSNGSQTSSSEDNSETSANTVTRLALVLDKNYKNLVVEFCYSNDDSNLSFLITDADGTNPRKPVSVKDKKATFELGAIDAGSYIVEIHGGDSGDCSVNLIESEN